MALGDIVIKVGASAPAAPYTLNDLGGIQLAAGSTTIISDMFEPDVIAFSADLAGILTSGTTATDIWVEDYTRDGSTPRNVFAGNLPTIAYGLAVNATGLEFNGSTLQLNGTVAELAAISGAVGNVLYFDGSGVLQEAAPGATSGIQAYDAFLTSIAAQGTAADKIIYTTGVDTAAEADLTAFARTLLDDADAATARTTLGIDGLLNGLSWKEVVLTSDGGDLSAATLSFATGTLTISGLTAGSSLGQLDGIEPVATNRVLITDAANAGTGANGAYNGIWEITGGTTTSLTMTRTADADEADELVNAAVFISQGTTYADIAFVQTVDAPITVDTTALVFTQFSSLGVTYTASNGVIKSANDFQLNINSLTAAVVDVATDFIAIEDTSDTNLTRKESIADLISAVAGTVTTTGLSASSGVLSLDINGLTGESAIVAADEFAFNDSGVGLRKITYAQLLTALNADLTLDNYVSWSINADATGAQSLASGETLTVTTGNGLTGNTATTDTLTLNLVIDTTGGANLSTAVNLSGNGLAIAVDDVTVATSTGSGQLAVKDNGISALQLNVAGNGTSGQVLSSDGDGSFSWTNAGASDTRVYPVWAATSRNTALDKYMEGPGGATMNEIPFLATEAIYPRELRVKYNGSTPAAGESFVVTVYDDAVATNLTVTVDSATVAGQETISLTGQTAVAAGSEITIKVESVTNAPASGFDKISATAIFSSDAG